MAEKSEPSPQQLHRFAREVAEAARSRGQRLLLVISGRQRWCHQTAQAILRAAPGSGCGWFGGHPPAECESLRWERARTRLGTEAERLVIDVRDGFDAEGFGALTGSLRAGGLLLLLTPPLAQWPDYPDPQRARFALYPHAPEALGRHFIERLVRTIVASDGVLLLRQGEALPPLPPPLEPAWQPPRQGIYAGAEQAAAVAAISEVATAPQPQPLVLSADRGRGKSAALGIAAAQLLRQGVEEIVVSAPRIAAAQQLFSHAAALLPGCEARRGLVAWQGRVLRFMPPDELLRSAAGHRLLLVDEAAAIPTALLGRMLDLGGRAVFATTIHGYEGTGRGFSLRFYRVLDARCPGWRLLHLSAPVRWAVGDPLEALAFRALLLDAEPAPDGAIADAAVERCRFERLDVEQLAGDEQTLSELFGLLVLAHYRTSPNDLRQLLDGVGQSLYVLRHGGHVVAAALAVREGELPAALAREVYLGRRRVQGHLLPQSLANHAGFAEAATRRALRIMRIVVHPRLQRRGLGGALLEQVRRAAAEQGCDYVGASFGATAGLLDFWSQHGFLPVRVGLAREAASGSHAVMVLCPLSPPGKALFAALRERLAETLPELLAEPLADLEAELVEGLLATTPPQRREGISAQDWQDLNSFAFGLRGYELCLLALRKLVHKALADGGALQGLAQPQQRLLQEKVVRRRSWAEVAHTLGYSGRRQAQEALRQAIALLLRHYAGEEGAQPSA